MAAADAFGRFVGRSSELEHLASAYAAARGGSPRTVVIGGEAGIGKTRLIEQFLAGEQAHGATVLSGACLPLAAGTLPYQPFVAALRTLVRTTDPGRLPALLGPARGELARLLPELGPAGATVTAPDDMAGQARLFELVLGVIERIARDGPVIVVVEDLQWADVSTRDMLTFLVGTLHHLPVLLIASARTDAIGREAGGAVGRLLAELDRDRGVERIELGPLDRSQVADLAESLQQRQLGPAEVDELVERTDGNPFFVEQLVAIEQADAGALSPGLRDILQAQLDALSDDGRTLVRAASAAGRRLDDRLLACVIHRPLDSVDPVLGELVERGILVAIGADDDPETPPSHAFRHALLRERAYDDLFAGERVRLHGDYARCLAATGERTAAGELAFHWDAAGEPERALAAHVLAIHEANRGHANAEALGHARRAIELWAEVGDPESAAGGDLARLLRLGAEAAVQAGEPDLAVTLGRRAVELIDPGIDPVRAGEASERLRWYLWEAGERAAAEEAVRAALDLLPVDPPSPARSRATAHLAGILLLTDRWHEALEQADSAIAAARSVDDRATEAFGLGVRGMARAFLGEVDPGVADMREALAIAVELDSTDGLMLGYANLAVLLDRVGRAEDAIELALEGYRKAVERGLARTYGNVMIGHAAKALVDLGRWDDADRLTREALERGATGRAAVWLLTNRGRLEARRGDTEAATDHLTEARRVDVGLGGTEFRTMLLAAEAELALADDRPADVRPVAAEGLAIARAPVGVPEPGLAWLAMLALRAEAELAEAARARHDSEAAEEAADRAAAVLGAIDVVTARLPGPAAAAGRRATAVTALCHGEVTRVAGQPDAGPWSEAAAAWEELDRPYLAAYARYREAEAVLSTRGPRELAERALRSAYRISAALAAAPLLADVVRLGRQARIGLVEDDAGTTVKAPSADHGFTPRELEVLRLVAGGWSNRQIADELFISPKTVSVHVSSILGKLGVDSRVQAAAAAHRLGLAGDAPLPPDGDARTSSQAAGDTGPVRTVGQDR